MNPLDENTHFIDPATVSPRPTAMRYGLIWGLISVLLGLVTHFTGANDPSSPNLLVSVGLGIVSLGVSIAMIVLAIKQHRDQELGGYISFGRAFTTGFWVVLVSLLISVIWTLVYTNFIAPELFSMDMLVEQWEEAGMSEAEIENAASMTGMFMTPVGVTAMAAIGGLIWGSILALIISAVMKKDAPNMA